MSLVWERAPYTAGSLIVLLALADWANDEGVAWPSMDRLAQKARIDRRSAQRIVRQLEKDGVLEIEHGGGRAKQHKYVLKMETATICRPLSAEEKGDISDIQTATLDPETATSDAQRATLDPETATRMSPDPSVEPLEEPSDDPPVEPSALPRPRLKKIGEMSDDEFFTRLETDSAYVGIDVRKLNNRMIAWCEVNGKRPTRRRLVNWLNRQADSIGNGNGSRNGTNGTSQSGTNQTAAERRNAAVKRNLERARQLRSGSSGTVN